MGLAERTWPALDAWSRRLGGVQAGKAFAVALSGGPDSTALAHVYQKWLETRFPGRSFRGQCIVVNHNLRRGSGEEALVVSERARDLGLSPVVRSVALESSKQEVAREGRLRTLLEVGLEFGAKAILLGHTRSDQLETFLMRAMRASGIQGLRGIPEASTLSLSRDGIRVEALEPGEGRLPGSSGEVYLVRPLLGVTKGEVLGYCADNGLEYVEDPSNVNLGYTRNAIRDHFGTALEAREDDGLCRNVATVHSLLANSVCPLHSERLSSMRRDAVRPADAEAAAAGDLYVNVEALRRHPVELVQDLLLELVHSMAPSSRKRPRLRSIERMQRLMYQGKRCAIRGIRCIPVPETRKTLYLLSGRSPGQSC